MEDKEFDNEVKKLRRMHSAGIVILITLTGLAHIFANKSTATSPIIIFKSILLLYMFINIPLMAWQYNKTVKEKGKQLPMNERKIVFLRWSLLRTTVWGFNVMLCALAYSLAADTSSFYLGVICFLVYLFFGKTDQTDIEEE